ncbi:MAG: UDP-N-acetylmuramoyl-L-alanyl-D-glutamate--2,6-diaminopimelate ligase, partial [Rhodobacteraceae bacterium]|nr:UDP-N-acetylmuramoyl-L-alanyl-D-glutamate--2,6-diaminopimelate ligase [Paracoccaceae bacterium]
MGGGPAGGGEVGAAERTLGDLGLRAEGGREARVTGLALDSRAVAAGTLFAALPGTRAHGATFVPAALALGAAAVLTDAEGARACRVAVAAAGAALVVAADAREALARAAALWHRAQPATVVAVTGTNGKTSVAGFARQLWQAQGLLAASIGTTGVEGAFAAPLGHTTPDALTLHRLLAAMAAAGVTHAAMEASSHGLDQRRLEGVQLSA